MSTAPGTGRGPVRRGDRAGAGRAGLGRHLALALRLAAGTPDPAQAVAGILAIVREALDAPALAVLRVEGQRLVPCATAATAATAGAGDGGGAAGSPLVARRRDEVDLVPPGGAVFPLVHGGRVEGVLLVFDAAATVPAARGPGSTALLDLLAVELAHVRCRRPAPGPLPTGPAPADPTAESVAEEAELQERLRALGTMASTIAHDFNNALSPVLGYVDLLLAEPDAYGRRSKARQYLELIRTGAEDAVAIVTRLRPFYRSPEPEDHRQTVAIGPILEQLAEQARQRLAGQPPGNRPAGGVEVVVAPDLPPVVGDATQVRAALGRLLANAIEATPARGTIVLAAHAVDGGAVVEVQDSGPGMSEVARRRCIEPFFTTREGRGRGLGLSIAYGIARRHGGTLAVESTLGLGTTVRLRLPAAPPGVAGGAAPAV